MRKTRFIVPLLVVLLGAPGVRTARAQAVAQFVQMEAPSRTVAHNIDALREDTDVHIAVFRSNQTATYVPNGEAIVRDAVYYWELLLLGLRLKYRVLDDRDLSRGISSDYKVIILPGVASMSERQKDRIVDYLHDGGGVIASGRTGVYDEEGVRRGGAVFEELFGAEYVENLPSQPFGILQSIDGNTPLGDGIPMGYRLNIAAQIPMSAARPGTSRAVGRPTAYQPDDQAAFDDVTLLLTGESEKGRYFWSRFHPHEVSKEPEQQQHYQTLVVNAIADLVGSTTVSVGPWPNGNPTAFSVASLPSVGFNALQYIDGLEHMLDVLEEQHVHTTFFFTSDEITSFQDLYGRAINDGEIGLAGEDDHVLKGQPFEVQRSRLMQAMGELGLPKPHGLYPPGGFYDGNTVRTMDNMGLEYMVLSGTPSLTPGIVDWWSQVDYRERLKEPEEPDETVSLFVPGQTAEAAPAGPPPLPKIISTIPLAEDLASSFEATYEIIREARGMYVVPFYPELYDARSVRAADFEATLSRARLDGSWITSVSEILIWWRKRSHVRPLITSLGRDEMYVDIDYDWPDPISGVTLEIRFPRQKDLGDFRISGGDGKVYENDDNKSVRVVLPELSQGITRFVLSWDN